MQKLINTIKKLFRRSPDPKVGALLWELDQADAYIQFLREAMIRGYTVEIAVIVDNQVCHSTTMANPNRKAGRLVLEYLQGAAIGERMRLWAELQDLGYKGRNGP